MTVLIPMLIAGFIMGGLGSYFAVHEGQEQHGKAKTRNVKISVPPATQEPEAQGREQSSQRGPQGPPVNGIPLHG